MANIKIVDFMIPNCPYSSLSKYLAIKIVAINNVNLEITFPKTIQKL
jgi:hypothetical protein